MAICGQTIAGEYSARYFVMPSFARARTAQVQEAPILSDSLPPAPVRLGIVDELIGYHIRRAAHVFLADFAESVSGTGMRQVLFGILSVIAANPGISQGKVGEALGIQRNNMATFANELEQMGLVNRATVENNRRALALTITTRGQAALEECLHRIREHENRLLADFSADERARLAELLGRIEWKERQR